MSIKKPKRVHVECVHPSGLREFKRLLGGGNPPIGKVGQDGSVTVLRPDRFERLLEATACVVIEQLAGARRARKRR